MYKKKNFIILTTGMTIPIHNGWLEECLDKKKIISRSSHALIVFEFVLSSGTSACIPCLGSAGQRSAQRPGRDLSLYLEMLGSTWISSKLLDSSSIQRSPASR